MFSGFASDGHFVSQASTAADSDALILSSHLFFLNICSLHHNFCSDNWFSGLDSDMLRYRTVLLGSSHVSRIGDNIVQ